MLVLILTTGCASTNSTHPWEHLGSRSVNHTVDRDEIRVGAHDGSFRKIKLRVRNRAVEFGEVRVHYGNGTVQSIDLRRAIPAGGATRDIDLVGGNRVITKVVFWYKTVAPRGEKAVVQLYGRH